MRQPMIWALAFVWLVGCGSKPKPPAAALETVPVYDETPVADPFSPIFALLNQSRLGVFVSGNGLNLNRSDTFERDMVPGVKVNVVFSDETETIERLDPTRESFCGIEFKKTSEEANRTLYRLYLTNHSGSYDLSLTGTRIFKTVWAHPELTKAQAKALVKEKPWCAYYAHQVNYGTEFKTAITLNVDRMKNEAVSFRRFALTSPGLVIESEDFGRVWETAMSIRQIFMSSGAGFGGFAFQAIGENALETMSLWDNLSAKDAQAVVDRVLNQDQGQTAVEARLAHVLADHTNGAVRLLGLEHDLD